MRQQLCDHIDQLDLALDQLALKDRNFDRFAIMLIDNVVELILHQHAQTKARHLELGKAIDETESKLISKALGQHFDRKVKLAKHNGIISAEIADSLNRLHAFRNSTYHRGIRHEGILHSLAIFYFLNCCDLGKKYRPSIYSIGPDDEISHRAVKYIGNPDPVSFFLDPPTYYSAAWDRLRSVGEFMRPRLVEDLASDMSESIDSTDDHIRFILNNAIARPASRSQVVIECQARSLVFSDKGKDYARDQGYVPPSPLHLYDWLIEHYPFAFSEDPIPSWRLRHDSLLSSNDPHKALEKYCFFMEQTSELRSQIEDAMCGLEVLIQQQFD